MIGFLKANHRMVNVVGFSWVDDMQVSRVPNNQVKQQNRNVVVLRWQQTCRTKKKMQQHEEKENKTLIQIEVAHQSMFQQKEKEK